MTLTLEYEAVLSLIYLLTTIIAILAGAFLLLLAIGSYLTRFQILKHIILWHTQMPQEGYTIPHYTHKLVGQEGIAQTPLRPSGKVRIQHATYQATTSGTYIQQGDAIVVTEVAGHVLVVEQLL